MPLEGIWYNELGSKMVLSVNGTSITGTYQTKVGDAFGLYPLVGGTDTAPIPSGQAVGLVVTWANEQHGSSHSVTSWSGQYQVLDSEEMITAFWLLTIEADPDQDWKSTLVGKDLFTRHEPSEAEIARRLKVGPVSHPLKLL